MQEQVFKWNLEQEQEQKQKQQQEEKHLDEGDDLLLSLFISEPLVQVSHDVDADAAVKIVSCHDSGGVLQELKKYKKNRKNHKIKN